ncbi:MAG: phosphonate ABC transporter, permease protein PhnE, partial [Pseudomonadota bacterium]
MTDAASTPPRFDHPSALAFLGYAAGIALIVWSFAGAGFSVEKVITAPPRFADFIDRAFPPNLDPRVLERLGWKMLETLQIAVAGAVLGVILSVPVALLAARDLVAGRWVNQIVRTILGFVRAVPDIAWALVFVVAVGLGPFA